MDLVVILINKDGMKKVVIVLSLLLLSLVIHAQSGGAGTSGDPYWGDVSTSTVWSVGTFPGNTVYIGTPSNPDIRIISNGNLTIGPGMTIVFKELGSDLIITGTGRLSAGGTGSSVTFTKDASKSYWGHISFQSMDVSAGSSAINNCIIEYGDVRSNSGSTKYGGGIYADLSNLTIKNSTIQHNKAEWGGGIFVNEDESPGIENCYIYDNYSKEGGGGIYLWNRAKSLITNCIFQQNHCDGTTYSIYTGGGLGSQSNGSIKLLNCTFVNNTSSRTFGQSIMLYVSTSNLVTNCLVWGNTGNHFSLSGTNTIQYTAVQGSAPTGTGNFVLSSNNSDITGPNFTDPSVSNWLIKVISPCRDAGTIPSPTVPNDYVGNLRIGVYDIGAYEVQYNYWLTSAGSSDWNTGSNWNGGVPTNSQNVVISSGASNYPIGSATLDYTIGSGYGLVLEPGAKATFNTLTKNGDLKLLSNSNSSISSLITNNSVNAIVELYLTGGGGSAYKWHYISSPISSLPVNTFILKTTMDFAQYFEARPSTNPMQGWIGYDGYIYYGGGFLTGLPYDIRGTNLILGKGYNYYYASNQKFSFAGQLNVSSVYAPITFGGVSPSLQGFNLLGNPFSSGLDWTMIINDAGFPSSTSKGLYFTRNNAQCSFIAGVGYPDQTVTGIIPPMQGFFIHTTNTSATIPLLASARAHNIPARYKGAKEIIPLVRLQLDNDSTKDNTVVRFDIKASATIDNDFDAVRMFLDETVPYIYSTDGFSKYAINGQPFPETIGEYPIIVNLTQTGNHTLNSTQLQGLDDYSVYLVDNSTGFTANLKTNPVVTFSASAGLIQDRFILKVTNVLTGNEAPVSSKGLFNIYNGEGFINIQTLSDEWAGQQGSVLVLDIAGKTVSDLRNTWFNRNSIIRIPASYAKGLYFVELRSGSKRYIGKVIIR